MLHYKDCRRLLSYIVGCLGMLIAGAPAAVSVYMNAVKQKFNYEQWEVEFIVASCNFGFYFGMLLAGIVYEKCGTTRTTFFGVLLACTGCLMLWSTTYFIDFYSKNGSLQALFNFLIVFGVSCVYIAVTLTNIENFSPEHRGRAMGCLSVFVNIGTVLIAWIYGFIFIRGHIEDSENQDIRSFYLSAAIMVFIIGILCCVFLRQFPVDLENIHLLEGHSPSRHLRTDGQDLTGMQLFKTVDFQFFLWAATFSGCVGHVFQTNVGTYMKSFNIEQYTTLLVIVISFSKLVAKLVFGLLSDLSIKYLPRVTVMLAVFLIQTITTTMCIFFSDNFTILLLNAISIGMTCGCIWSVGSVVIRDYYGKKYYGRNFGFYAGTISIFTVMAQLCFGWMYQMAIPYEGKKDCYGKTCFRWTFVLHSVLSLISAILCVAVFRIHKR